MAWTGTTTEHAADEVQQLKVCINGLIAILAMPAIWSVDEPHQILTVLLEVLVGALALDFVYARIKSPTGGAAIEMVRRPQPEDSVAALEVIRQALGPWLTDERTWPSRIRSPIATDDVSVAPFRLGLTDEMGVLVAASGRADFPTQAERLLLNVAANQAAIGLQEARRLGEQTRLTQELDRKVAQRTEELVAANKELKKEIAQRKDAEEALRQTQVRLSRATQVATAAELSASIAHEINQPLTAVVANADASLRWLSATPPNLERVREAVERIVRDGKDAGEVVQRIRALFLSGAVTHKGPLDLNEVIAEVVSLLQGETRRKQIVVETDLAKGLPPTAGDRVQLQQVVLNLLHNGIEAMDTVLDRPKRIFIHSGLSQPSAILIEIEDRGVGLDDPERVFEPFFTTKKTGMGMGLAIARTIVQAHQGRLWAERRDGVGATFCFTVPVKSSGTD